MVRHVRLPIGASVLALGRKPERGRRLPLQSRRERARAGGRRAAPRARCRAGPRARRAPGGEAAAPAPRGLGAGPDAARSRCPALRARRRAPTTPTSTSCGRCAARSSREGCGALVARGLGRLLARLIDRQESFNSRQVQFDNAILDYIDARLAATHRHYDAILGDPRPPHGRDRRAPPHHAGGAGRPRARPREAHRPRARRIGARPDGAGARAARHPRAPAALEERLERAACAGRAGVRRTPRSVTPRRSSSAGSRLRSSPAAPRSWSPSCARTSSAAASAPTS